MIAPNMATLLVFVLTDARIGRRAARRALARRRSAATFNAITVDGDMSTNDTVLLLASGAAGNPPVRAGLAGCTPFHARASPRCSRRSARLVVLDGEGGLAPGRGRGDGRAPRRERSAWRARSASSTLCKAAFHGGDPNWGRFVCAAGTAGVPLDADRVDVDHRRRRRCRGAAGRSPARWRARGARMRGASSASSSSSAAAAARGACSPRT